MARRPRRAGAASAGAAAPACATMAHAQADARCEYARGRSERALPKKRERRRSQRRFARCGSWNLGQGATGRVAAHMSDAPGAAQRTSAKAGRLELAHRADSCAAQRCIDVGQTRSSSSISEHAAQRIGVSQPVRTARASPRERVCITAGAFHSVVGEGAVNAALDGGVARALAHIRRQLRHTQGAASAQVGQHACREAEAKAV